MADMKQRESATEDEIQMTNTVGTQEGTGMNKIYIA
jgi:hypothetical protein